MFSGSNGSQEETVIAEGLKIEGKVTADGLVRVKGQVIGDVRCTKLEVADRAVINGTVTADTVVVDGTVEGPIRGSDVVLKSNARVTGDIHHTSLTIEKGAMFDGRSKQVDPAEMKTPKKSSEKMSLASAKEEADWGKGGAAA